MRLPASLRVTLRTASSLLFFAVAGTALLAFTFDATKGAIARNEERARLKLIGEILPAAAYDNALLQDTLILPPAPELGTTAPSTAYRARRGGQPVAVVMEAVAPDGYGGKIKLLLAIRADGRLSGVRVLNHNETPGLGDYIESAKDDWINVFAGKSLAEVGEAGWKVKKDGGIFPYRAGATVTPRAVVSATGKALAYFATHRDTLFAPAGGHS